MINEEAIKMIHRTEIDEAMLDETAFGITYMFRKGKEIVYHGEADPLYANLVAEGCVTQKILDWTEEYTLTENGISIVKDAEHEIIVQRLKEMLTK